MINRKLSIIIVHWNTPEKLNKCLTLLVKSKFQIIVIDNASDKNVGWIQKEFPNVELIENKINRGYAFACNQGVSEAKGEWLLFLNPDVEINSDQVNKLLNYAERNNLDACSVRAGDSYQKPLPSWFSLVVEFSPLNQVFSLMSLKNFITLRTLFGGCLLIKKEVLKKLGGWDERFFLWFEDSDLTQRLMKNNFKTGWIDLPIKHSGGASFKNLDEQIKKDMFFNSMDVYAKKHFNIFGQSIVGLIIRKYTKRKLLPELFNGISLTVPNLRLELLTSFLKQTAATGSSTFQVGWIIVTSSIKDSDIWDWRKKYPEVRFISIDKNSGFAPTVNIGFRVSTSKWVGTVNDDVTLTKDWLTNLFACSNGSAGSLNPVISKPDGSIESAGIKIEKKGKAIPVQSLFDHTDSIQPECKAVDATNAAAVIYSKEALNKTGLFDEKFGSYLEDIDLSLRLKRKGYKNIVSLNSLVKHQGQSSAKNMGWKKQYLDFKNWILIILKNWSLRDLVLNFPAILIERLRNLSGIVKAFFYPF